MFAAAKITSSLTKFNWALSKLPFSLIDTIGPLCKHPSSYHDPYQELQDILLPSYGLSVAQMTSKWLDYSMYCNTRPSVMRDHLTALQPATVKEVQTVLFLRKLPRHIRNLINPRAFKEPEELIQRCNEIWEDQTVKEAAAAAAAMRPHSPLMPAAPPLCSAGRGLPATGLAAAARPPLARPEAVAATACASTTPASVPRPRRAALTRKTNRPAAGPTPPLPPVLFKPAAPPLPDSEPEYRIQNTEYSHSNVFLTCKKLDFSASHTK
jgi:hypothetical protein